MAPRKSKANGLGANPSAKDQIVVAKTSNNSNNKIIKNKRVKANSTGPQAPPSTKPKPGKKMSASSTSGNEDTKKPKMMNEHDIAFTAALFNNLPGDPEVNWDAIANTMRLENADAARLAYNKCGARFGWKRLAGCDLPALDPRVTEVTAKQQDFIKTLMDNFFSRPNPDWTGVAVEYGRTKDKKQASEKYRTMSNDLHWKRYRVGALPKTKASGGSRAKRSAGNAVGQKADVAKKRGTKRKRPIVESDDDEEEEEESEKMILESEGEQEEMEVEETTEEESQDDKPKETTEEATEETAEETAEEAKGSSPVRAFDDPDTSLFAPPGNPLKYHSTTPSRVATPLASERTSDATAPVNSSTEVIGTTGSASDEISPAAIPTINSADGAALTPLSPTFSSPGAASSSPARVIHHPPATPAISSAGEDEREEPAGNHPGMLRPDFAAALRNMSAKMLGEKSQKRRKIDDMTAKSLVRGKGLEPIFKKPTNARAFVNDDEDDGEKDDGEKDDDEKDDDEKDDDEKDDDEEDDDEEDDSPPEKRRRLD